MTFENVIRYIRHENRSELCNTQIQRPRFCLFYSIDQLLTELFRSRACEIRIHVVEFRTVGVVNNASGLSY